MISVLMTVYNESIDWVSQAIRSIKQQTTIIELELVIVVDNPNYEFIEDLKQLVKKNFSKNVIIINEINKGLVNSLNTAFRHSHGEYIARMDSDDISLPERFEKEFAFLQKSKLDFVASSIVLVSEHNKGIKDMSFSGNLEGKSLNCVQRTHNEFWHPTWFMKREVMQSLAGYRALFGVEDYDFVLRAILCGFKLGLMGEATLKKRFNKISISELNTYKQFVYSKWLIHEFKDGREAAIDELPIINVKEERKFINLKHMLTNRHNLTLIGKINFFKSFVFYRNGYILIKNIILQKLQIKVLVHLKGFLKLK